MKDFIKWLGVNDKIAKLIVWIFIIMALLVMTNTLFESIGLPFYKITYQNLFHGNVNEFVEKLLSWIITILNFYSTVLLIFRLKETKKLFKYSMLYLLFMLFLANLFNYAIRQFIMIVYMMIFCFLYSKKNWKYACYVIIAIIINFVIQFVSYYFFKMRFIDYEYINQITRSLLSMDYFIIMAIIILVKEIYLKKRGEKLVD